MDQYQTHPPRLAAEQSYANKDSQRQNKLIQVADSKALMEVPENTVSVEKDQ